MQMLCVALLIGSGALVVNLQKDMASVKTELGHVTLAIADIKTATANAYTVAQANRDRDTIKDIEQRVRTLEVRGGVAYINDIRATPPVTW